MLSNATPTTGPFSKAVDHLKLIGEQVREKTAYPGDPIRREFCRVKASFIRLAILMGEPDAARKFIEGSE